YTMGLGREGSDPQFPGQVLQNLWGEMPQRMFYNRWAEFMTATAGAGWPMPSAATKTSSNGAR
ncbi:MAG: hypothetical protein M3N97_01335, partial [Pseudomonadota bacterium]|nr:hypothetical protein [Pseudomonadota bacterium]